MDSFENALERLRANFPRDELADIVKRQQADIDKLLSERQGWLDEIERLRDALRDIHDDLIASHPFAYTTDATTIEDFQEAADRIDDKAFAALYPEKADANPI